MFCPKCGTKITDDGSFCPNCGNQVKDNEQLNNVNYIQNIDNSLPRKKKSKAKIILPLLLLIIVLGVVGVIGLNHYQKQSEQPHIKSESKWYVAEQTITTYYDEEPSVIVYKYRDDGQTLEINNNQSKIIFDYTSEGYLSSINQNNENYSLSYEEKGSKNVGKTSGYVDNEQLYVTIAYDKNNRRVLYEEYSEGMLISSTKTSYDSAGNVKEIITTTMDGSYIIQTSEENIKTTCYYRANGKMYQREITELENDRIVSVKIYEYEDKLSYQKILGKESNNSLSYILYDANNNIVATEEQKLDENGNVIESFQYDDENQLTQHIKYQWLYKQ
ncbi:MAG: zinc ribbon domain-containing protein [Clostridia bacterium]|nr:zinc ribbon domain-containing protein [Clostridia bacterium]